MAEISKTADQALVALLKLSESGPMTAAELSRSLHLNRTVVHRLLATLHQRGFIIRQNGAYVPGALLVRMAERVQPDLRAATAGVMRRLAAETGETAVLHIADGNEAVVLEQVVGTRHVVRVEHRIGSRHALSMGASGRALLAFMDSHTSERVIKASENPEGLRRQLETVRQLGYALSHDELQNQVYGLAVPVNDQRHISIASLAIVMPSMRAASIAEHLPILVDGADAIGASLYGDVEPSLG